MMKPPTDSVTIRPVPVETDFSKTTPAKPAFFLRQPYTVLAVIVFTCLAIPFLRKPADFDFTYLNSARFLWSGQSIYHNGDGYIYPPFPALVALPLAYLPTHLARLVWFLASATFFLFIIRWSWQLSRGPRLQGEPAAPARDHLIFWLGIIPGATYAFNCLSHSQTDLLIGFAIIGGCIALMRDRDLLAATAFGVAAAMKGPALLWFPYLLWRRRPLAAGWMIAVFIAANLAPNLIAPLKLDHLLFKQWITTYLVPSGHANVYPDVWYSESNQSILGSMTRWMTTRWEWVGNTYRQRIPRTHAPSVIIVKAATVGIMFWMLVTTLVAQNWTRSPLKTKTQNPNSLRPGLEFSTVILLMLLFSPMAAKAQWGTLLLPGFCLARLAIQYRDPVVAVLFSLGLCAWLCSQNILGNRGVFVGLWYGAVLWNAIFFWLACVYYLLRFPKSPA